MDKKGRDFQHEAVEDTQSVMRYLQSLAEGFRSQTLAFQVGSERFVLEPSGLIHVEIKAKNERRKSKLTLKFSWKEPSGKMDLAILDDRG